jgi:phosphoglycerate dehydrogenase-like enzyme
MMQFFDIKFTGDLSTVEGKFTGDVGLDILQRDPKIRWGFLEDQRPKANDPTYQERLYSMEIGPHHVASANAIVVCRPYVKAEAFANGAAKLVAIARAGIGYDKIDLGACTENDVIVFNTPHGMTHSTAAAAMFFILALSKRFHKQQRIVREHRWDLQMEAVGDDLAGLTLGIVGLGKTGLELARLFAPFKMRIIAYSPHADPGKAKELNIELRNSLDEVLRESDYVSLHGRLDNRTRGMIGERELRLMKPTAYFVNVARGEMVDEHALIRVLQAGLIAGAGLDVFEVEPLPKESPLLKLDNVILTPHWMCSTHQSGRASVESLMQGVLNVASGALPDNILNPDVIARPGFREKLGRFHPRHRA